MLVGEPDPATEGSKARVNAADSSQASRAGHQPPERPRRVSDHLRYGRVAISRMVPDRPA